MRELSGKVCFNVFKIKQLVSGNIRIQTQVVQIQTPCPQVLHIHSFVVKFQMFKGAKNLPKHFTK